VHKVFATREFYAKKISVEVRSLETKLQSAICIPSAQRAQNFVLCDVEERSLCAGILKVFFACFVPLRAMLCVSHEDAKGHKDLSAQLFASKEF